MEYTVIVQKNPETGVYTGQCREVPEAVSQGNTLDELLENMKEAIALAVECRKADLAAMRKSDKLFFRKVKVPSRPRKSPKNDKTKRKIEKLKGYKELVDDPYGLGSPEPSKDISNSEKNEETPLILERQALMNEAEMLNKSVNKNDVTLDEIVKDVRKVRKEN